MKKMILPLMMVLTMTIGANAQRLDNTYMEARILNAAQWNLYKKASYFYRPISWRQGTYVHNIYAKYPTTPRVVPNNRVTKPMPQVNHPVFDGEHFFDDVIGVSKNLHNTPRTIKFWASAEQSKYIKTKPLHTSQKLVKENEDGSCVFKIEIVINFEMYSVFMSYGPGVRILSPRQAVSYMRDKTKEMALLYEQDFSNHNETKK